MQAQHGLTPRVMSTRFLSPLFESGLCALPLTFLFGLAGPQSPSREGHPHHTRDQQGARQVATTHPEPVPMGGRKQGVVATKPCMVRLAVDTVSTLL